MFFLGHDDRMEVTLLGQHIRQHLCTRYLLFLDYTFSSARFRGNCKKESHRKSFLIRYLNICNQNPSQPVLYSCLCQIKYSQLLCPYALFCSPVDTRKLESVGKRFLLLLSLSWVLFD